MGTSISVPGAVVDRIRRRMNRVPPALCDHCKRVEQIARALAERHGRTPTRPAWPAWLTTRPSISAPPSYC